MAVAQPGSPVGDITGAVAPEGVRDMRLVIAGGARKVS
jgi:hypothetical protein